MFSDEQIAKLKRGLRSANVEVNSPGDVIGFCDIKALLRRLEAAERVFLQDMTKDYGCACKRCVFHEKAKDEWLRSAGKEI